MSVAVLFVGNFLSGAGAHRHYCEELADRLEGTGSRVLRTSQQRRRLRRLADMLVTAFRRRRDYDVVHVDLFSGPAFFWAEAVCLELRRLQKPFVLTLRGGNLPVFSARWPRRTRRLLSLAAAVTAPSSYLRDALVEHRPDIVVIPNAIDTASYPFVAREHVSARLVWLRAFHSVYNPCLAVDVVAALRTNHPDVSLRMYGPDKSDGSIGQVRRRAEELGVTSHIELFGKIPKHEVPSALGAGDVFLNTTDIDNVPISVLEAMSCGMCVVSTSVGGIPYVVDDERDGLLVPPRDAAAMATAVERLLADPSLAARLSRNARQRALERDWTRVLDRWETLFSDVAHA